MNVFRRRIKSPSSSQEVPSSALSNPWRIPICQMRKPRHESVSASWDLHPGLQEASQVALVLKNLPCQCRRSLAQEDPLEEGMATHSSILVWKIPWTEELDGLQSIELQSQIWLKWISTHAQPWILAASRKWKRKERADPLELAEATSAADTCETYFGLFTPWMARQLMLF